MVFLDEPHHATILIDQVLREKGGLLASDDELGLLGVEDEDIEVIEQEVVVKVFAQLVKEIDVGTRYHIV